MSVTMLGNGCTQFSGTAALCVSLLLSSGVLAEPGTGKSPGPAPRRDAWKVIGMGGGGTMILPTISPHDPNIVVEGCDMTGAYITTDGGNSFRMLNLRTGIGAFAFDPAEPGIIYAGNDGLWRSEDAGWTWSLILPDPAKNTFEHMRGDHAEHSFTTDDPAYPGGVEDISITAIAVDPADSRTIYVAFNAGSGRKGNALVVVSKDRGRAWMRLRQFDALQVMRIDVAPGTGVVTCVLPDGVSRMSGGKWEDFPAPEGVSFRYAGVGRTPDGQTVIYATADASWRGAELAGGVYVSTDGGSTWRQSAGSLAKAAARPADGNAPQLNAIDCSAGHARVAYLGFRGLVLGGDKAGAYNGIAKTTDAGATWRIVKKEGTEPPDNAILSWVEPRMRENTWDIWFDAPRDLAVAPGNGDVCYATDLFRTYRTTDGGRTWETVNSVKVAADRWTTRGLDVTTCYGVHFDPFDRNKIYISYTDMGMFRSDDGGKSWTSSIEGIPSGWRNTTYWLEFDPQVEGLVWGAFAGPHDLPRPKMWRRNRSVGDYTGGVATSTDGGRTWKPASAGMGESAVTHVIMDPASPKGMRTLYACGFGRGVFKSADNGKTWSPKNSGIEGKEPFAWRIVRARDGTLYLIVARRSDRGEIGDENDGALYRSTDGAGHWVRMALPEGTNGPNGLALDPCDPKRMYLAAWGKMNEGGPDTGGGIFLSTDAGKTWKNIMSGDQHVYDVTIDPRNGALYACGFESSAYRSDDGGRTWKRLRGYNFKWGHRVIPDPANAGMVYITTFGGSVWYGPAAGDPNAVEDIVTPIEKKP